MKLASDKKKIELSSALSGATRHSDLLTLG
jgi:hypothetical protein